jgi:uncharacterized cupin superfamily protein
MPEAEIVETEHGDVPRGDGWYVLNAKRARWRHFGSFGGSDLSFQGDVRFPDVGVHLGVLRPGEPASMYHYEDNQEGFLVLAGELLVIVEGQERLLGPWDYFHCPRGVPHALVGAGVGPCLVFALGARRPDDGPSGYLADETARRYGAAAARDTTSNEEAYAGVLRGEDGPAPPFPPIA